jgi:long-chain acyl-CoA synthetase
VYRRYWYHEKGVIGSSFKIFPIVGNAAIGIADAKQRDAITVFFVKSDPTPTEDAGSECCKQHLTGCKHPKYIEYRDDLPKTIVRKMPKSALPAAFWPSSEFIQ